MKNKCSIEGCNADVHGFGMCDLHYRRMKKHGNANQGMVILPDYIVDTLTGCWNWQKAVNKQGYGRKTIMVNFKKKTIVAHRYIYEQIKGEIPPHYDLHHKCKNTSCVNPEHLEPLTRLDHRRKTTKLNEVLIKEILDSTLPASQLSELYGIAKGTVERIRSGKTWKDIVPKYAKYEFVPNHEKTHCKYGHEFTPENTYYRSSKKQKNQRICIECKHRIDRARYHRSKGIISVDTQKPEQKLIAFAHE